MHVKSGKDVPSHNQEISYCFLMMTALFLYMPNPRKLGILWRLMGQDSSLGSPVG